MNDLIEMKDKFKEKEVKEEYNNSFHELPSLSIRKTIRTSDYTGEDIVVEAKGFDVAEVMHLFKEGLKGLKKR